MQTTPELEKALHFVCRTGQHVFLTGKAGTGKTTLLRHIRDNVPKRMVVLAPTGVAAVNAGGMTIHSFFQFSFGPYLPAAPEADQADPMQAYAQVTHKINNKLRKEKINILRTLDLLIIDEVSMVRADLLDAISDTLCFYRRRREPFGGVQLLLIGDVHQLAPIARPDEWQLLGERYETPYFFSCHALQRAPFITISLTHIFRQSDSRFIELLNRIRDGRGDRQTLALLNSRHLPDADTRDGYITLTTHNQQAQAINSQRLEELAGRAFTYNAEVDGVFPESAYPTDEALRLKEGAQVMFIKNDSSPDKAYYNGRIGVVTELSRHHITVTCPDDGVPIEVQQEVWENTRYTLDPDTNEITEDIDGTFRQFPLKTAWAITIHKSQGLTFDKVVIDAAQAFAHGQVYVALSRCRTLEGIVLRRPIFATALVPDHTLEHFQTEQEAADTSEEMMFEAQRRYFLQLCHECFDFEHLFIQVRSLAKQARLHLSRLYPQYTAVCQQVSAAFGTQIDDVARKFRQQITRMVMASRTYDSDGNVAERILKASQYFDGKLDEMLTPLIEQDAPDVDDDDVNQHLRKTEADIYHTMECIRQILRRCGGSFSIAHYLKERTDCTLETAQLPLKRRRSVKRLPTAPSRADAPESPGRPGPADRQAVDIPHPELYRLLTEWRREEAARLSQKAYTVLSQKAVLGIARTLPRTSGDLAAIDGIGPVTMKKYAATLLEMTSGYYETFVSGTSSDEDF